LDLQTLPSKVCS